eukprot:CCRYP_007212-RA/>CCRYP_007212-RA protein AED:0.39 eAED:0.39 QI:135/1/1/1/1/1/4/1687/322
MITPSPFPKHKASLKKMISILFIFALLSPRWTITTLAQSTTYGVDVSFPIHHHFLTETSSLDATTSIFGNARIREYSEFFSGCLQKYARINKAHLCHQHENQRMQYNRQQPPAMTNYTAVGFKKTNVSDETWEIIQKFWRRRVQNISGDIPGGLGDESWPEGNTYCNHWSSPTKLVPIRYDRNLTEAIYNEVASKLNEWIPQATFFTRSDIYGIRVYTSGSILATHIDRDPLISSAIINVDQNVEEPWPLEAYDHEGRAHNLTLEPGEMILYESHSVLHGRPFALRGDYYANIFVHFKPKFYDPTQVQPDDVNIKEENQDEL